MGLKLLDSGLHGGRVFLIDVAHLSTGASSMYDYLNSYHETVSAAHKIHFGPELVQQGSF